MKSGNWVPLSKALVNSLPRDRPFTELEAMFSLQVDYDCNRPCTVRGFSTRWQWSRNKVLHFLKKHGVFIEFEGAKNQFRQGKIRVKKRASNDTSDDTGKGPAIGPAAGPAFGPAMIPARFIDYRHLQDTAIPAAIPAMSQQKGQQEDQQRASNDTSEGNQLKILDPIKDKKISPADAGGGGRLEDFYTTKRRRQLKGERLAGFALFWDAFGYKEGKADAADAWLNLKNYSSELVGRILVAAKREAAGRPAKRSANKVPIMAQGWLTGRRWEDEPEAVALAGTVRDCFDYSALQVGRRVRWNGGVHVIEEGFVIRLDDGVMPQQVIKSFYRRGKMTLADQVTQGA